MKTTLTTLAALPILLGGEVTNAAEPDNHQLPIPEAKLSVGNTISLANQERIILIGGGLGSRMNIFNEFETELQRRNPEKDLFIRNLCKEGDTPAFRPHPARNEHWVFPGAKALVKEEYQSGEGQGFYETPDQWMTRLKADTVIGFFGYSEAFDGLERLEGYKAELRGFIKHTLAQKYNGKSAPKLAIVSPAAFEDLSAVKDLPNGEKTNTLLAAYTKAMAEVCKQEGVLFFDALSTTHGFYSKSERFLTSNGHNLTEYGYRNFSRALADGLFGKSETKNDYAVIKAAVAEKNRLWLNDYKMPNGVHSVGRRHKPFGDKNYPQEYEKIRQMTDIREQALWAANKGKSFDVAAADAKTIKLPKVETNFKPSVKNGTLDFKSGKELEKTFKLPEGYKIELFADEKMFPNLQNPSQMAFDNKGRLWIGCMGSYPHYKIGDPLPNDKIIMLEDTNNDGKADKETIFVDNIHIPMGFEISDNGGAYVSLGNDLALFSDTDGDGKADKKEYVLSGFDDHDTHHAISGFCADPSGAIFMGEGVFLHSNIETPYGPVRGTNGGFYRFNPAKGHLERTAQYSIPNPWGIAFDRWGQNFFLHTSGSKFSWMQQTAVKSRYDVNLSAPDLLRSNKVRPTSGLEFVSSGHFPDEVQGDMILCNNIGYKGGKQHKVMEDPVNGGYTTEFRHDLFSTEHGNFRPVDLEFAPDGSLFVIDWHNPLIGHMQHNARDPHRDHVHGRVYRITYPSRPLVKPAQIDGASIATLLDNLKLKEYRSRYRSRRELRGREASEVAAGISKWVAELDENESEYEHHLLEALWVSWGINMIDEKVLAQLLEAKDHRARAAAVRATRYNIDKISNALEIIKKAASDKHSLVRHEAVIAASWIGGSDCEAIIAEAKKKPVLKNLSDAFLHGLAHGTDKRAKAVKTAKVKVPKHVKGNTLRKAYIRGKHLYEEGENCASCHQKQGDGLAPAFPPLDGSKWVNSDKELLAKIALHGLNGKIEVKGKEYTTPMPGFAFRKTNAEIADMLTYIRNAWSNQNGDGYTEIEIADLLKKTEKPGGMYDPEVLLKEHPLTDEPKKKRNATKKK